ncbi:hypothetical protein GGR62_003264 [Xanthomonas campestris]|nr:hypothetical protein [Xanthomonas sp. 3075]
MQNSVSEQEVKPSFTEPRVLAGLFDVIHSLYGLTVKPDGAPVWREDVRFYRLQDAQGALVGQVQPPRYRQRRADAAGVSGVQLACRPANRCHAICSIGCWPHALSRAACSPCVSGQQARSEVVVAAVRFRHGRIAYIDQDTRRAQ